MTRISMDLQKEIQFLKLLLKTKSKVARRLNINRETVGKYWEGPLKELSPQVSTCKWIDKIDWEYVVIEREKGVSLKTLYKEYVYIEKLPIYTNFARYYRLYIKKSELKKTSSLKIERTPGQTIEVDYSGDKIEILNPSTGEIFEAELFVAALSFSGHFTGEFTLTQKLPDFLNACQNALKSLGKVPKFIVSDNCLTAVTKAEKYDTHLNKNFIDFCHHYQIIADPARVFRPKDKPNVENAIGVIQKEFFQEIRNKTYTSLLELNLDLKKYLKRKMDEKIYNKGFSRNELLDLELPVMRDLPEDSFELFSYKKCKVHPDCHIRFNRNFYSVPSRFIGQEVEVKAGHKMIYIYAHSEEIASHLISPGHTHYITNDLHYPDKKLIDVNYHIQSSVLRSKKIGPNTECLVKKLFEIPRNHPLRNLAKVQGILALGNKFRPEAMEYAAESALISNKLFYTYIKSCAKNYREEKKPESLMPNRRLEFVCLQGGLL